MTTEQEEYMLVNIRRVAKLVASKETAYKSVYEPETYGNLHNHCGCVADIVQSFAGGELLTGTVKGVYHIWNKLPSGLEVDLTSEQFGGDGWRPLIAGKVLNLKSKPKRYTDFSKVFHESMGILFKEFVK